MRWQHPQRGAVSPTEFIAVAEASGLIVRMGDWMIEQFPLAQATLDEPLQIGADIGAAIPIDRTIQAIQQHKQVYSARLHPLLCALTSAHYAAYAEEASRQMPGIVSGKFRSMLIDVFGRSFMAKASAWSIVHDSQGPEAAVSYTVTEVDPT
mgnify:CR=1 FL=1